MFRVTWYWSLGKRFSAAQARLSTALVLLTMIARARGGVWLLETSIDKPHDQPNWKPIPYKWYDDDALIASSADEDRVYWNRSVLLLFIHVQELVLILIWIVHLAWLSGALAPSSHRRHFHPTTQQHPMLQTIDKKRWVSILLSSSDRRRWTKTLLCLQWYAGHIPSTSERVLHLFTDRTSLRPYSILDSSRRSTRCGACSQSTLESSQRFPRRLSAFSESEIFLSMW